MKESVRERAELECMQFILLNLVLGTKSEVMGIETPIGGELDIIVHVQAAAFPVNFYRDTLSIENG